MPDDTSKAGRDRKLISLEEDHEVRAAVKAAGNSADKVREYLQRQ